MNTPSVSQIEDLWRTALSTAWHGASCSCHGGGAPVVLSAAALEEDLLDYLLPRYRKENLSELVTTLEQRQSALAERSFLAWLQQTKLAEQARQRLLADVEASLASFCETNANAHH